VLETGALRHQRNKGQAPVRETRTRETVILCGDLVNKPA
jgi:hypothetical protein